ncbi:Protein of unknown function [Paramicrobacterium humi]|uniref:DinB superfamily protein n=2 Tax=Paramicrobacterium humi TaxID=640635 RepID=A0A1H4T2C1_9MICO|nr:Protein of unknown function [Microbacterium humi]
MTPKDVLRHYLQEARDTMLWKLEDLGERDIRRPMTATGTNLLGLVKHVTGVELGYFGQVFDRPAANAPAWLDDGEDNEDMWATADESREFIVEQYRSAWAHSDSTIDALELDASGTVPWWRPESRAVTLQRILVHVTSETARHAGHADIVRELIDERAGLRPGVSNLPSGDAAWWREYRERLQKVADSFDA